MSNNEKPSVSKTVDIQTTPNVTAQAHAPSTHTVSVIEKKIDGIEELVKGNQKSLFYAKIGIAVTIVLAILGILLQYIKFI